MLYLPALCHKMQVPFAVVNNKAQLGQLCHAKNCTAVAFTGIRNADAAAFEALKQKVASCVDYKQAMKHYGGNVRSQKSLNKEAKKMQLK